MHFHLCILLYAHYIMYFPIVIMCHPFKLKLTPPLYDHLSGIRTSICFILLL